MKLAEEKKTRRKVDLILYKVSYKWKENEINLYEREDG